MSAVRSRLGAILAAGLLFVPGCLFHSQHDKVVECDAIRTAVAFENDAAMQRFQHTVNARYAHGAAVQSESDFCIPFLIAVEERRVLSESAWWNTEVVRADADADGTISEAESVAHAHACFAFHVCDPCDAD